MDESESLIAILYNDDSQVTRGNPHDLLAVQYTSTVAQLLFQALEDQGYRLAKIAVRARLDELEDKLASFSPKNTFIFNNCDGFNGNNMGAVEVIRLIERMGFLHTGAPAEAIELCIDKPRCKARLVENDIPTPRYQVFDKPEGTFQLEFPVIVKPSVEDASMGIDLASVVCDQASLFQRVAYILDNYQQPAIVEEFISGRELAVAMLSNGVMEVLPIVEDDFSLIADPLQQLLTYESKWDPKSPFFYNIPSRIPAPLARKELQVVRKVACDSFRAMGLRDLGRVDIRLRNGIPYVIDINELPDLAPESGFYHSAEVAGYTYPQLVKRILGNALKREGWK